MGDEHLIDSLVDPFVLGVAFFKMDDDGTVGQPGTGFRRSRSSQGQAVLPSGGIPAEISRYPKGNRSEWYVRLNNASSKMAWERLKNAKKV